MLTYLYTVEKCSLTLAVIHHNWSEIKWINLIYEVQGLYKIVKNLFIPIAFSFCLHFTSCCWKDQWCIMLTLTQEAYEIYLCLYVVSCGSFDISANHTKHHWCTRIIIIYFLQEDFVCWWEPPFTAVYFFHFTLSKVCATGQYTLHPFLLSTTAWHCRLLFFLRQFQCPSLIGKLFSRTESGSFLRRITYFGDLILFVMFWLEYFAQVLIK